MIEDLDFYLLHLKIQNLGAGITIPYFFALNKDKNFILTNRLYVSENPLIIGEYHQAFKNSNFLFDFGYTDGFKKTDSKKRPGKKSHFFSEFTKNFKFSDDSNSNFKIKTQEVSNDKYLKLYKLKSDLIDYNETILQNSIDFIYEKDDLFFGFNSSIYEYISEDYPIDKYEYIYPDITINKNLVSNNTFGNLDLETNYQIRKYETNKFTNFLINDLNWNHKILKNSIFNSKLLGNFKNINYEVKNVDIYKKDTTSELFGAFGYLSELNLIKDNNNGLHKLSPKVLLRYAPGEMRKEIENGYRLTPLSAFSIDKLDNEKNFETGLSGTIGFDYSINKNNKDFDFSIAQIINNKENKKMHSKTSLDEKLSDIVGESSLKLNDQSKISYNFSLDQNYSDINYIDFETQFNFDPMKIVFNYILENKHIGDQEYFKGKLEYAKGKNGQLAFETKRNLVTNSAEFYNLSYEYFNDCLRAGLVYRREFYKDSELEPENSLMFKVTLVPFGSANSPSFGE